MRVCGDGSGGGIRRGTTVLTGIPCGNMFRACCFVGRLDAAKLVLAGVVSFLCRVELVRRNIEKETGLTPV